MLWILLSLCVLYALWTWHLRNNSSPNKPPYFEGVLPIIGNTLLLLKGPKDTFRLVKEVSEYSAKKGGVIRGILGFQQYYVITDPDDALTAANNCLQKHFAYQWAKPFIGNSLIISSGEVWKNRLRMITPAFSLPVLHGYLGVFNSQGRKLVKNLSTKIGITFDTLPYIKDVSFKSFCMTAFGIEDLDNKDMIKKYMTAIDTLLYMYVKRFHNPLLYSDFMCILMGFKKKEEEMIRVLSSTSDAIIKKKRTTLINKESNVLDSENFRESRYKSLLDLLLQYSSNGALTEKEITEEVNTFIVAGYDTCSVVIPYILMCLGTYPEVQEKVYKEIQSVFGDKDINVEKTDLSQLVYTEAAIKETLRLYPPGPALLRQSDKEVQLKKYKMPAGTQVVLSIYGINRDSAWGPDAHQFRPDRWLKLTPGQNIMFGSFSLGKRSCPGQHFALIFMKTIIVHIIRHYRISANIHEVKFQIDFLMIPVSGCNVVLERRNENNVKDHRI